MMTTDKKHCFWCQSVIINERDEIHLTDNTGQWRTLCLSCPKIPVQIILVDPNFYCTDFSDAIVGLDYDSQLRLSPDPEHYGLWIQEVDGTMKHNIGTRHHFSHDLTLVCFNQERKTLVLHIPEQSYDEWNRFRQTWPI